MRWLLILILTPTFVALSSTPTTVRATLRGVDPVERELRLQGQRRPFVATFSSTLSLDGRPVRPAQFWGTVQSGMVATVKSRSYGPFRVVDVASVDTGEK